MSFTTNTDRFRSWARDFAYGRIPDEIVQYAGSRSIPNLPPNLLINNGIPELQDVHWTNFLTDLQAVVPFLTRSDLSFIARCIEEIQSEPGFSEARQQISPNILKIAIPDLSFTPVIKDMPVQTKLYDSYRMKPSYDPYLTKAFFAKDDLAHQRSELLRKIAKQQAAYIDKYSKEFAAELHTKPIPNSSAKQVARKAARKKAPLHERSRIMKKLGIVKKSDE